jgi:mono/diheme cytochrome c family protein
MPTHSRQPLPLRSALVRLAALALWLSVGAAVQAGGQKSDRAGHPAVPGLERFFTAARADAAQGGRLLLGELSCVSCHRADPAQAAHLTPRQAPTLDGVGARVKRAYLRKFLSAPHAAKPGTAMPDVLTGLPAQDRARKIEELVHFLASTGALRQERPQPQLIGAGRTLYHQSGCVACHGTRDAKGEAERLLPTSVPLGDLKAKHGLASLAAFLENPHQTRPGGRMPKLLNGKEALAVANYLLQGIPYEGPPPNLSYAYYEGAWEQLPDFAGLKPRATGMAGGFDLSLARRPNNFALKFEGFLHVDREGTYRFHLTSDDGSKVFVGGQVAANNDGIHPPTTTTGTVKLTKGVHPFVAAVFNAGGGVELKVEIEGPGLNRQSVAPLLLLTPEGNPKVARPKSEEDFALDPALVERGRATFVTAGCANCHTMNVGGKPLQPRTPAPALATLRPEGGCLAPTPAKQVPRYPLSAPQRAALAAAVKGLVTAPREAPAAKDVIARTMTALNCYACHQRDKVGGVEEPWNSHFATSQPEMGDEGRIPPPLDGVGAKLNPGYLRKILADGSRDRPYLHTRMPGFGAQNAATLAKAFEAADPLIAVPHPKFKRSVAQVKGIGRRFVGDGSLACIKCHTFAGHKAEGVQGMDMTLMTQRVRREWFHRYLLDPQKVRPGTRMPASWPNGVSFYPDILDGDPAKQIESIWLYLSDGKQARLPLGLKKQYIILAPGKEAIIYRNFLQGAGARAIGVGYPEKAHLAFDAGQLRLALLWQGAFLDASRHWTDRGSGFEGPLGDNVLSLPAGPSLAVLGKDNEPWPNRLAPEMGYKFRGYRLTPDQRPTFLYSCRGVQVEDFPNAVASKRAPSIRRTLSLTAEEAPKALYFRAAVGDRIEALGKGWYRINGEWRVRIESAAPPVIRDSGGKKELVVPVRFDGKRATLVQEIVW